MKTGETKCECLWSIPRQHMSGDEQRRRVYSTDGLCPTLMTPSGGYFETKIAIFPFPRFGDGSKENENHGGNGMSRKDFKLANTNETSKTIVASCMKNHKGTDNFLLMKNDETSVDCDEKTKKEAEEAVRQERRLASGLRIRKLTEGECMRLMGFEKKDTDACKAVGLSKANVYHQAGDSIVTTVLVGIFGELLGVDYGPAIDGYAERLHGETE